MESALSKFAGVLYLWLFIFGVQLLPAVINSLSSNRTNSWVHAMYILANAAFFTCFGLVAAVLSLVTRPDSVLFRNFGFLVLWTGRGSFLIIMAAYHYAFACSQAAPGWGVQGASNRNSLDICSRPGEVNIVSIMTLLSIIVGFSILVLRYTMIYEVWTVQVCAPRRGQTALELMAAVASSGMMLAGGRMVFTLLDDLPSWGIGPFFFCASLACIFLLFGTTSLVASITCSPTIVGIFGFLDHGLSRGLFYLFTGFYMFAMFFHASQSNYSKFSHYVCWVCALVSIIVGVVIILTK